MPLLEIICAMAGLYLLAAVVAVVIGRIAVLPAQPDPDTLTQNAAGRMTRVQRRALLLYAAPELVFSVAALVLAFVWNIGEGLSGQTLRWGLAGMALVRLGILLPLWRDLIEGQVVRLDGPLRLIAFRQRYALATENGPIVVLPAERGIATAYEPLSPVTIFYAPHTKRVIAVQPQPDAVAVPPITNIAPLAI